MAWVRSPFLWGILVVVALVVLASRLHSTEHDLATAYRHFGFGTRFPWLVLALGSEAISFLCYAQVQRLLLRAGGAHLTRRTMLALAVAATGLTNLVPGGTAPASGWLVGQYRRRAVPMPLALWSVLAGGFAATVSILLLLLVGAAVAGFLATSGRSSSAGWSWWPGWWGWWRRCTVCRRSPSRLRGVRARRGVRFLRRLAHQTSGVMRFRHGAGRELWCSASAWPTGRWTCSCSSVPSVCWGCRFRGGPSCSPTPPLRWPAVWLRYRGEWASWESEMIGAFALAGAGLADAILATIVYRAITCWLVAAIENADAHDPESAGAGSPGQTPRGGGHLGRRSERVIVASVLVTPVTRALMGRQNWCN